MIMNYPPDATQASAFSQISLRLHDTTLAKTLVLIVCKLITRT